MCGIAGWYNIEIPDRDQRIGAALRSIKHRGPDGSGWWVDNRGYTGMLHTRLAIQDLSERGRQPMQSTDGRYVIAFNGEIYNFKKLRSELSYPFVSETDTEVILAGVCRYGIEFVEQLRGMFAFALFDRTSNRIHLCRDRAGEKPLYYMKIADGLIFASELKAIFALTKTTPALNYERLPEYLSHGYCSETCATLVKDVYKVSPGCRVACNGTESVESNYWRLPVPMRDRITDIDQACTQVNSMLEAAVRDCMVADVPVGVLLSGGIDSSLITYHATKRSARPLKTFTIVFPESRTHDESVRARRVALACRSEHIELDGKSERPEILQELARQFDEPLADSSMIPTYIVSRLAARHCKVVLGGDGGDELFGGYTTYDQVARNVRRSRWLQTAIRISSGAAGSLLPYGFRGRRTLLNLRTGPHGKPYVPPRLLDHFALNRYGFLALTANAPGERGDCRSKSEIESAAEAAMRSDFVHYLPGDILAKVDRASMLSSIEVRAPLLDVRLVEFCFGCLDPSLKAAENGRKFVLRELARRAFGQMIDTERKQGFSVPLKKWMTGSWGRYMIDVLEGSALCAINRSFVRDLKSGFRRGYSNSEVMFALVMLELWMREYNVTY